MLIHESIDDEMPTCGNLFMCPVDNGWCYVHIPRRNQNTSSSHELRAP